MVDDKGRKAIGKLIARGEEVAGEIGKDLLYLQIHAKHLEDKDFFGKSDGFLVFFRSREDGTFAKVHTTEVINNNLNP